MTEEKSLFERLGGEPAIDAAVDIFYRKVLQDERISRFFDTVDMERQHVKQKAFLTMAFGGPNHYSGDDMRTAHAKMRLTGVHFDAVMEHLSATLRELGVGENDLASVAKIAESVRGDVLNQ